MDAVEEIKSRLDIEDVVSRYVDLKRSGSSYKGLCPFHQEKTPSFYVSPSRGTYHCFGCSKGGDIFSFVMEAERLSFPEVLNQLAEQAGVALPERESKQPSLKGRLYEVNEAAAEFFRKALDSERGTAARRYLAERGFNGDAIERFGLGYAPEGREALVQHLRAAGFEERILLTAGLAVQDDIGGRARDRFRGRLMLSIRDRSGRVTGFGGRTLGEAQPKYLNSPQTEIFDKSATLFGIDRAEDAVREAGKAVLVEGYFDAIRAHMHGYAWVVASLGTAVTMQQLSTLSRLTEIVILALDPDPAGQSAAARTSLAALAELTRERGQAVGGSHSIDLRIARLPADTGDPDELIHQHPDVWERAIEESVPAFEFYFTQTLQSLDRSPDTWRQDAIDQLLPVIQQFGGSAGWQALWLERLARETGIDPRALQRSITGPATVGRRRPVKRASHPGHEVVTGTTARALGADPGAGVERILLAFVVRLLVLPSEVLHMLSTVDLENAVHRSIVDHLLEWQSRGGNDHEMFRERLPEELREYCDDLRSLDVPLPKDGKIAVAVESLIARLRHFRLESRYQRASKLLEEVGFEDRAAALAGIAELMQERRAVEEELDRLSRRALQSSTAAYADQGTIDQDSGRL